MRVTLIAVGAKMPKWVNEGFHEYTRRMPSDFSVGLQEIALPSRGKKADIKRLVNQEGEMIAAAIPKGDRVIALDVNGTLWNTVQLAENIKQWRMRGDSYSLLIGGPDGLSAACLALAEVKWSLSPLTLPHPLVRVIVAEQLYRAWSVIQNHPYHR